MMPIQKLISRIRWDREFGQGDFVIGYQDRFSKDVIRVPLEQTSESAHSGDMLRIHSQDGEEITIPLHRIVEVLRNGVLIWQRER